MERKGEPNRPPYLAHQEREETLDWGTGRLQHWTEEVIAEAQKRGDFDHLKGKGKPLNLSDYDPYAGGEAEGYKILKNAGFVPEWAEARKKIADELNWLRANPTHPERISRIVEVNLLIDQHNRAVPSPSLAFPKVPKDFGRP